MSIIEIRLRLEELNTSQRKISSEITDLEKALASKLFTEAYDKGMFKANDWDIYVKIFDGVYPHFYMASSDAASCLKDHFDTFSLCDIDKRLSLSFGSGLFGLKYGVQVSGDESAIKWFILKNDITVHGVDDYSRDVGKTLLGEDCWRD